MYPNSLNLPIDFFGPPCLLILCSRANTSLGSSKYDPPTDSCACVNPNEDGSTDDCNCVHLPYSDGASFAGFRAEPWAVPNSTQKIWFRGIKNFDGVLDFALAHGMKDATEVVITGGSAGGLSTFLHADRMANRVKAEAPSVKKIRAMPVVGPGGHVLPLLIWDKVIFWTMITLSIPMATLVAPTPHSGQHQAQEQTTPSGCMSDLRHSPD